MRKLTYGMNVSLDGYIAGLGGDIGWSVPSDELFQWWSDRVAATDLALYGRKLWETMSDYWPMAQQQPGVTPADIEFAQRWMEMRKVVFSSTVTQVDWNTSVFTGDPVPEIARLKAEDGGPMDIGGATLAAAAMRAGLIDEYVLATAPCWWEAAYPSSRSWTTGSTCASSRLASSPVAWCSPGMPSPAEAWCPT